MSLQDNQEMPNIPIECHEDQELIFDRFIPSIKESSKFHKIQFGLICLVGMLASFILFSWVFIAAIPEFRCKAPVKSDEYNFEMNNAYSETFMPTVEDCGMYKNRISLKECQRCYTRVSLRLNTSTSSLKGCDEFVFDRSIYKKTLVEEWSMVCDRIVYRTSVQTSFLVGLMAGSIFFSPLSDKYGRKPVISYCFIMLLIVSLFINVGNQLNISIKTSYIMFASARFCLGFTVRGIFEPGFILCTEMVHLKERVMANAIINYAYVSGLFCLTAFAYFIRTWRMLLWTIFIFCIPYCSYIWIISESPRWLLRQGRYDEAEKILKKFLPDNGKQFDQEAYDRFKRIQNRKNNSDSSKSQIGIKILFKSKTMCLITLNLFFQWFTQNLVYYGISQNMDGWRLNPYISYFLGALVELFGYILFHNMVDRSGRRLSYVLLCSVLGITAISISQVETFLKTDKLITRIILLAMNICVRFCATITYSIIYLFTGELFPTDARTTGLGYCSTIGRLGAIMGTFCNDYLIRISSGFAMMLYGLLCVFVSAIGLLLPEASNRPLPQTIDEIDRIGLAFGIRSHKSVNDQNDDKRNNELESMLNIDSNKQSIL